MALARHKTIREALLYVADNPDWPDTPQLDMPIWEIVARNLYEHANNPSPAVVGSMGRATKAQKIILNRTTGTRRAGTHPAVKGATKIQFNDLTTGAVTDGR